MQLWRELLADVREALRQNPWLVRGAAGIAALLVLMGVLASAASSMTARRQVDGPATEATTTEMSDQQRRISDSYDDSERGVVDTLTSYEWYDADGHALRFTGDSYSIDDGEPHSYAVSAVKAGKPVSETYADNEAVTSTTTETTATLLLDDGSTSIATITVVAKEGGATRTLECDALGPQPFSAHEASSSMSIDAGGHEEQLSAALGGSLDAVTAKLRSWADNDCPTATTAAWDGRETVDHVSGTDELTFRLDDPKSTEVTVRYHTETGGIEILGGGSR